MKHFSPELTQGSQTENAAITKGDEVLEGEILSEKIEVRTHVDFAKKYPGFGPIVLGLGELFAQKKEGVANGKLAYIASLVAAATQKKAQISLTPGEKLPKTLPTHLLETADVLLVLEVAAKEGKKSEATYLLATIVDVIRNTRSEKDAQLFVVQLRALAEKNAPKDTVLSNTRALEKAAIRMPSSTEPEEEKAPAEAILSILDSLKSPLGQVIGGLQNKENRSIPETFGAHAKQIRTWFLETKGREALQMEYGFNFEFDDVQWEAFKKGMESATTEQEFLALLQTHLTGETSPKDVLTQLALSDTTNKYLNSLAKKTGVESKSLDELLDEGLENDGETTPDEVLDLSGGAASGNGFSLEVDTETPPLDVETNTNFTGGEQPLGNPEELFGLQQEGQVFDLEEQKPTFERKTLTQELQALLNTLNKYLGGLESFDPAEINSYEREEDAIATISAKLSGLKNQAELFYKLLKQRDQSKTTEEELANAEQILKTISEKVDAYLETLNPRQNESNTSSSFLGNVETFVQANGLEKEWGLLSEGQKAIALRVFDQNALMYIESLSRNLHNEQLKEYESNMWGIRHVKKLWAGINRSSQVGKIAQEQLKSFVSDDANAVKKQMFESAVRGAPTDISVGITPNGTPAINFTQELQKNFTEKENAVLALNLNRQEEQLLQDFNKIATNFALIPEEYGSSTADDRNWLTKKTNMRVFNKEFFGGFGKTEKRIYQTAQAEFEAARDQVAKMLLSKGLEQELIESTYFSINNTVEVLQASQAMADVNTAFRELAEKGKMRKAGLLNDKADFAKGMLANIGISGGAKGLTKLGLGFFGIATTPVTLSGIVLSMGFAGLRGAMTGEGRAIEGLREQDIQSKYSNDVKKIALAELKLRKYEELLTNTGELTDSEKDSAIKSKKIKEDGTEESDDEAIARRLQFVKDQINSLTMTVYLKDSATKKEATQKGFWNTVKAYTVGGDVSTKKESLTKEGIIQADRWGDILKANLTLLDKDTEAVLKFKTANEALLDESNTTPEADAARAKFAEITTKQKARLAKIFQQVEYVEDALEEDRVTFGEETHFGEGKPKLSLNAEGWDIEKSLEYKTSALNNKMALKNMLRRAKTELFTEGVLSVNKDGEKTDEIAESFKEVERNASLITDLVAEKAEENNNQRTKYQKEQIKAAAIRGAFWALAIGVEEQQFGIIRDTIAEAREAVGVFGYDKEHLLHEMATAAHQVKLGLKPGETISYEKFLEIAKTQTGSEVKIPKEVFESKEVQEVITNGDQSWGTDRIALSADEKKAFIIGDNGKEEVAPAKTATTQTDTTTKTLPQSTPAAGKTAAQIKAEAQAEQDSIKRAALAAQQNTSKGAVADSTKTNPVAPPTNGTTSSDSSLFSRLFRMPWENTQGDTPTTQKPQVIGPNGETSPEQVKANALAQANAEKARILREATKQKQVADSLAKIASAKTQTTTPPATQTPPAPGTTPTAPTVPPVAPKVGEQLPTGKVTESVTNPDKSVKVVTEAAGGAKTVTTTSPDGKVTTQVNPDKSTVTTTKNADGSATQVTKDSAGTVTKTDTIPRTKSAAEIQAEAHKQNTTVIAEAKKQAEEAAAKAKEEAAAAAAKSGTQTAAPATAATTGAAAESYRVEDLPEGALITSKAGHNGISYALWEQMKHNEAASNAIAQEYYGKDFSELSHKQQVSAMYKHLIQQGYIKVDEDGKMIEDVRVRPSGKVAYVLQEDGNIAEYQINEETQEFEYVERGENISKDSPYAFEGLDSDEDGKPDTEDYEYTGKGRISRTATGGATADNTRGTGGGRGSTATTTQRTNPADLLNNTTTTQTQTVFTNPITNPQITNNPVRVDTLPLQTNQSLVFGAAPDTKPGVMQTALASTHLENGRFVAYKSDFKGGQSFTREGSITIKVPTANGGFKVGNIGYWQQVIANNPADISNPNISEIPVHFGPLTLNGDGGFNNPEALLQRPEVRAAIERGDIGTTIDLTKTDALTGGVAVNGNVGGQGGPSGYNYPSVPGGGPKPSDLEDITIPGLGKSHAADANIWKELFSEKSIGDAWNRPWMSGAVKLHNMSAMRLYDGGIKYAKAFLDFGFSSLVGKPQAEIEQNTLVNSLFNANLKPVYESGIFKSIEEITTKNPGDWTGRFIPGTDNEVVSYIKPDDDNTAGKLLYSISKNRYFVPKEIADAAFKGETAKVKIWLQVMETASKAGITPRNRTQDLDNFLRESLKTQEEKGVR